MAASWFKILVLLAGCVVTIVVLSRIELLFKFSRERVAAPPSPGPAHERSCYRSLWFRGIPVIFVTAFVGLFAMRFVREHLDIRADFRGFKSQISEPQISDQEVDLLAKQVLQGADVSPELIPVTVPRETTVNLPPAEPELSPLASADQQKEKDTLAVTVFALYATEGTPAAELPEWASQTGESEGLPRVITSGLNPKPIGAMADAFTRLSRLLSESLIREHPEAAGWSPKFSDMYRIGVIGRRAVQQSELTVGQFTEPMYQEFIEVVPTADLDARLFDLWRADTVNSRLLLVGGGMGILTLMFGTLAGYFRIDAATRGKYRRQLRAGVAAAWLSAAAVVMMIVEAIVG
ncbi:MAG: hypothetical protein AB7U20_14670 [Planctomycetaceae bacterium]